MAIGNYDGGFLLICVFGPIVACVSSWILYAFGQITEDVHTIRNKEQFSQNNPQPQHAAGSAIEPTSDLVQIQNEDDIIQTEISLAEEETERERVEQERKKRLEQMAEFRSRGLCQHCGGEFKGLATKKCSKCGISKNY